VSIPRLTRRGWMLAAGAAVAIIVAYSSAWRDLLYAGCILALLLVANVVAVRTRATSLATNRRIDPQPIGAGQTAMVTIDVTNRSWLRTGSETWRDLTPAGLVSPAHQPLPALAGYGSPRASQRLRYPLETRNRGIYSVGPMVVRRTDPFGLCLHEQIVGEDERLTVLPRIVPLEGGVSGRVNVTDSAVRSWKAGRGSDDVIAREYRAGDALRHVHWRATAHHGELMVRQEQRQENSRAVVVLDTRRDAYRSRASFEWAVSFAASLMVHLSGTDTSVTLVDSAADAHAAGEADGRTVTEALVTLATVERRTSRGDLYLTRIADTLASRPASAFVILGAASREDLADLAARRGTLGRAAVVLVDDAMPEVPEALWHAGWRIATATPDTDPADAWRELNPVRSA